MLIMLGNRIVNLDHVRDIEPLSEAYIEPGSPEVRVTFDDGDTYDAGGELMELRGLCGIIVPAPPGLVLVEQVHDFVSEDGSNATYVSSPILAFRVTGAGEPVPIAVRGEPWPSSSVAVLYPDGTCESGGVKFASIEAWQAIFNPEPKKVATEDEIEGETPLEPSPEPSRH